MAKYKPYIPKVGPGGIGEKENPDKRTVMRAPTTSERVWDSTEPLRNILSKVKNFALGETPEEELRNQLMPGSMAATGAAGAVFVPTPGTLEAIRVLEKLYPGIRQMFGRELGVASDRIPHSALNTPLEQSSWGSNPKLFYRDDATGIEHMFKKGGQALHEAAGGGVVAEAARVGGARHLPPLALPAESIATHAGDYPTGTRGSLQMMVPGAEKVDTGWSYPPPPSNQNISRQGGENMARTAAAEYIVAPFDRNNESNFIYNRGLEQLQPVDFGFPWDSHYQGRPFDVGELVFYRNYLKGENKEHFFRAFEDAARKIAAQGYSPTYEKLLELIDSSSWLNKDKARDIMQERLEFLTHPERVRGLWEDIHKPARFNLAPHAPGGQSPPSQPLRTIDIEQFKREAGIK